jgi:peptide deformylase
LIQPVLTYGYAVLERKAKPVAAVDESIRQLAKDLLETMYSANGVGLAAQQIDRLEAVCAIDVSPRDNPVRTNRPVENPGVTMPLIMINPRINEALGEQRVDEGCLSFPEIYVSLSRAVEVAVSFMDLEGRERTVRAVGLLARAIQHEIDHLNGVLLVHRMTATQKIAIAGRLRRLRRQVQEEARV